MGFEDDCFNDGADEMIAALLDTNSPYLRGITLDRLKSERSVRLNISQPGEPFLPFATGTFPTGSGRFEFGAESLGYTPPLESRFGDAELAAKYPLELISAKNDDGMNSTFGNRTDVDAETSIMLIHPLDAEARGIVQGVEVRAANDRGACHFRALLSEDVPPGVVSARSTRWSKRSPQHLGINRLTSDRLNDMGGGPVFYSCLVEVMPVRGAGPNRTAGGVV